jgi:tetratricopeptide (TPR) repeat protein
LGANALERLGQFPDRTEAAWTTHFAARICALAPDAGVGSDEIVRLAEEGVAAQANPWNRHTLALAYYRAGRLDEAAERARQSMEHSAWTGQPLNWLVLAVVDHSRGDSASAKQWLDKAQRAIPQDLFSHEMYFNDWVESMVLLKEAQAVMEMESTGNKPVP